MSKEIFAEVDLPTGRKAIVYEGKGLQLFSAGVMAKGNTTLILKYLIMQLVEVNGNKISEAEIDEMPIRDVSYLTEVLGAMMSTDHKSIM